ncbi:E3 ubiquitin-protein ligase SH3RF2 [Thalassophryne amazonica]|uniref:E3 ubiquitin-protein ligase SH3RF2 n=1 Tax=Thalassophryne amazonica TaxID=390379 RepID=UPI0014715128|nr:E3 ubiquitin-protein ligase SH3RF2 [Thalassophryne amazonica]XP_034037323.1 E3 ubiquitin-protein ligase SH3RF2 [Thalassophryne amazonica]XP_034037324.1 E3 ubiquitin-protein ligase SH3RF2 [Thalassophryne amazonica]XP_034037325.1 E3 ubiquitin-protein ligase SH3RF2 [Thalassophryne amazonica]XP_034037326.1 E3 ubiquitin-protein ligase SH3RF2 [Thalassophryne amazonica]
MEELALRAVLECPLCFEQLDVSAKVLPCQHTFCVSCLQRHEATNSQLFCPECRAPVPARTLEELPTNILLVQLLEGLQGSGGPRRIKQTPHYMVPMSSLTARDDQEQESLHREKQGHSEVQGVAQMLQPHQEPQLLALCRAVYDFDPEEMNLEDSQYCLSFLKGDILTVIRRVDEDWIEAKLGDKVGICPLQFTEPNSVAAKLLEGKSRRASDSAEFHLRTGSGGKDKAADISNWATHVGVLQVPTKTPVISALPFSNQRKQSSFSSHFHQAAKGKSTNISTYRVNHQAPARFSAVHGHAQPSRVNSYRTKHRSDSTRRHLSQSEKKMTSETPPTISMALINPQMAPAMTDSRNASAQQLSISVCAVLYSYKPRRPEELELKKGEMVGVYSKFREGWLRGLSLRTGKVGILPNNYITPVLRTSARLVETKTASSSSQHNALSGKKLPTSKNRVNTDGAMYSTAQVPPVPNGVQHAVSSAGAGKPFLYGGSQGWDTVRRIFNPRRNDRSIQFSHPSNLHASNNSQHFAQVRVSGYSPALQRKKKSNILSIPSRTLGRMTESAAPSTAAIFMDREFTVPQETHFVSDRQPFSAPQSILVKPDSHKNSADKPAKSVRFVTEDEFPSSRLRTSGSQASYNSRPGPPPLEVWAPSLTLGRDGPGIILKEGKAPILRKNLETTISDLNSNLQKPLLSQSSLPAVSAQFSPSRHRVTMTHLAQADSELSLLQGELVLVHRPRPDGRVLITQENSGQTGLFHSSILQALERLS